MYPSEFTENLRPWLMKSLINRPDDLDEAQGAWYHFLVDEKGTYPALAEMLAAKKPPLARDSSRFYRDNFSEENSYTPVQQLLMDKKRRAAKEMGVSVKGKKWFPGLANSPTDPEAWVPCDSSAESHIKGVLEKRGWGSEGEIKTEWKPEGEIKAAQNKTSITAAVKKGGS